jgi:uncharacterized protein YrzB (UPF0473 family)
MNKENLNKQPDIKHKQFTRREFLKAVGAGLVATFLADCQSEKESPSLSTSATSTETPIPTSTLTPTPKSTETPTPTRVFIPIIQSEKNSNLKDIPDPRVTNPELFDLKNPTSPIPQFVNAMRMAGIELNPKEVVAHLEFRQIEGKDEKNYILASYTTTDSQNTPYTVAFIAQKQENGWGWRELKINEAFNINGKEVSVRAEPGGGQQTSALEKFFRNWVITTTTEETTYNPTDPNSIIKEWSNGRSYLSIADNYVSRTPERVTGGHLVWGYEGNPNNPILPSYLYSADNRDLLNYSLTHLENLINHFYQHYPNKKYEWTVVAEATNPTLFAKRLGLNLNNPDNSYVILAFRKANEIIKRSGRERGINADRLAYSDFITNSHLQEYYANPNNSNTRIGQIITILNVLKRENLIDTFHLQIRYGPNLNPNYPLSAEQLSGLINSIYEQTGVPVVITELGFSDTSQNNVSRGFYEAAKACVSTQACLGIQFDKILPENSQENELFTLQDGKALPDSDYYTVISALVGR